MSGKSCGKRKRRPGRRGSCGGKRKVRRLVLVPLVTAVVLFSAIFVYLQAVIDPNLEDISRMRAEVLVTRTINRALSELFQEQTQTPHITMSKNKWKRTAYGQSFSAPKGERKRNEEKEMKKKKWLVMVMLVLVCSLMFGTTVCAAGTGDVAV